MMKRHALAGALVVVLILMLSACGTKTGNISGKVVDAGGSPVEGAIVEAAGTAALTDAAGYYTLENIPVGDHTIWATKTGVGNLTSEVTVKAKMTTQFDIVLQPVNE